MFLRLFLLFTLVPLVELYLLIKIGGYIGAPATIALVVATGIAGGLLAKSQGLAVVRQARGDLDQGRIPAESLFDGVLVVIAGTMLVTPGFITDLFGISLLIPRTRRRFKSWLKKKLEEKISRGEMQIYTHLGGWGSEKDPYDPF